MSQRTELQGALCTSSNRELLGKAVFPDFKQLKLHDLCLKSGSKTIVVSVLDECADSDCSGCCTENRGSADQLIDFESFTDVRWGVEDGPIQWADLGPPKGSGCQ